MQSRGGLRGGRWIAATGVGDAHAESQSAHPVAGGEVSEHRPRFKDGVNVWHQFRCNAEILRCRDRARHECVQMVTDP
jgi:hypothetical protein